MNSRLMEEIKMNSLEKDNYKEDDNETKKISIEHKFNLTIEEAALYFNIGQNKLREMTKESGCDFVLFVGKKTLIKRKKCEQYLNEITFI